MKNIKYSILFVAGLMLLASCNNLFDPPSDDQSSTGYGSVIINLSSGTERTALPDFAAGTFSKVRFTFTATGNTPIVKEVTTPGSWNTITIPDIPTGSYSVKVEALIGSNNTLVAEGTSDSNITVVDGTSNPVTIKLKASTTSGQGTFQYSISYPSTNNANLTIDLKKFEGTSMSLGSSASSTTGSLTTTSNNTGEPLATGSYVLIVRVEDDNNNYAGFVQAVHIFPGMTTTVSKTIDALITPMLYGISLSQSGKYVFTTAATVLTVTVTNSGNQPTGALTVALSGDNASDFTLSNQTINSITDKNETDTFTVQPKAGLTNPGSAPIEFSATVTVSSDTDPGLTASFTVEFTLPGTDPYYAISLSQENTYTFTESDFGYTAITPLLVTVTNTGNQATGALTVALSGTALDNFEITPTSSLSTIAIGQTSTFNVGPKVGLGVETNGTAKTYTATVTVSGGNSISETFNVSFMVKPKVITFGIGNIDEQAYTGTAITPTVIVSDGSTQLTEGTDYTKSLSANTDIGTVTVTVTGTGGYTGSSGSKTFQIIAPFSLLDNGTTISNSTIDFGEEEEGYSALTAKTITVKNANKTTALTSISIGLGTSTDFTVSPTSITSIAADGTSTFTVVPKTGLTEGDYTATVTVTALSKPQTFTVTFKVTAEVAPEPDGLKIKVAGVDQFVEEVTGVQGTATIFDEKTGYTFVQSGNYTNSYAYFKVDFGTDKLENFGKVTLNYKGVEGDITYKELRLIASSSSFSGSINNDNPLNAGFWKNDSKSFDLGFPVNGSSDYSITFIIPKNKAILFSASSIVYFSFFISAKTPGDDSKATTIKISDIVFEKDGGAKDGATLNSIKVKTQPSKEEYTGSDTFDPSGLVITTNNLFSTTQETGYTEDITYAAGTDFAFNVNSTTITTDTVMQTDYPDQKVTVTVEYKTKPATFEVKVGTVAPDLFETTDGIKDATMIGGENKATYSATTGIIDVTDMSGSALFTIKLPAATSYIGSKDIKIEYICKAVTGDPKVTWKTTSWGDPPNKSTALINPDDIYQTLADGVVSTLTITETVYADATETIAFQRSDDATAFKVKIISVKVE